MTTISAEFPYQSQFVKVHGSQMHYVEEGRGDPILFLHGIPTSSYLWRNIIPALSSQARCIAVDLIGMGKSDKPDIAYRVFDHIKYVEGFIEALSLKNITLVLHGWGSVIGFDYASRHEDNIRGLAFVEPYVRPLTHLNVLSLPMQQLLSVLNSSSDNGYDAVVNQNYLVEKVLLGAILRKLTAEEIQNYKAPFSDPKHRKPLWQYVEDLPLPHHGARDVAELIHRYSRWLQHSSLPKLLMYAVPGFTTTIDTVKWCRDHLPNLTLADLGEAMHCPQETNPQIVSEELSRWYEELNKKNTELTSK